MTAATEARRSRRPAAPTSADVLAAEPRAGSNLAVTAEGRALQPAWTAAWGEPRWTVNDVPAGDLEDGEVPRVATGVGPGYGGGGGGRRRRRLPVRGRWRRRREECGSHFPLSSPRPLGMWRSSWRAVRRARRRRRGRRRRRRRRWRCAPAQFYGPQFGANPRTPPTLSLSLITPVPHRRDLPRFARSPAAPSASACPVPARRRRPRASSDLLPHPSLPGTRNASWALRSNGPRSTGHPSPSPDLTRNGW